jgi:hypothetical protein
MFSAIGKGLSRRDYLKLAAAGVLGGSASGWFEAMARGAAQDPQRKKACILLWMGGGPSQMDTFDLKPGHENGGPFKEIQTTAPGVRISEHLPTVAKHADRMAIIRSMSTKEGDHPTASAYLHTGYSARGPIRYPTFGSLVAKELGDDELALPHFVRIGQNRFFNSGSGFLGPKYAPMIVAGDPASINDGDYEKALRVGDLTPSGDITPEQSEARTELLREMQKEFLARHAGPAAASRNTAYDRAVRLMRTSAAKAFDLEGEPAKLRDRYGRNRFGQCCLMARRLVEHGVPFVEVGLESVGPTLWDSHVENFTAVARMCAVLDPAWGTLMEDLKDKGLLDSTLIIWMGEFGRTPKINANTGRDHFPNAWSTVLAGGGIKGGQVVGKTSKDGTTVEERLVSAPDFLVTVCRALGIDPDKQNVSNIGRPIRIVEKGAEPIKEVLA